MARAFSKEWIEELSKVLQSDEVYNDEADGFDRTVVLHIQADPDKGVAEDLWVGFNPPAMDEIWAGSTNENPDSDYIISGSYADWHAVNSRAKGLVASLLDQSIQLAAGKTSYIAMFVPAVDRFFEVSKTVTDSYDGQYTV